MADLNTCTARQLALKTGIPINTAKEIVKYRKRDTHILNYNELWNIDGMTRPIMQKLKSTTILQTPHARLKAKNESPKRKGKSVSASFPWNVPVLNESRQVGSPLCNAFKSIMTFYDPSTSETKYFRPVSVDPSPSGNKITAVYQTNAFSNQSVKDEQHTNNVLNDVMGNSSTLNNPPSAARDSVTHSHARGMSPTKRQNIQQWINSGSRQLFASKLPLKYSSTPERLIEEKNYLLQFDELRKQPRERDDRQTVLKRNSGKKSMDVDQTGRKSTKSIGEEKQGRSNTHLKERTLLLFKTPDAKFDSITRRARSTKSLKKRLSSVSKNRKNKAEKQIHATRKRHKSKSQSTHGTPVGQPSVSFQEESKTPCRPEQTTRGKLRKMSYGQSRSRHETVPLIAAIDKEVSGEDRPLELDDLYTSTPIGNDLDSPPDFGSEDVHSQPRSRSPEFSVFPRRHSFENYRYETLEQFRPDDESPNSRTERHVSRRSHFKKYNSPTQRAPVNDATNQRTDHHRRHHRSRDHRQRHHKHRGKSEEKCIIL
ncbi:hypothetical protein DPMN_097112 [Dreissena polymorpha]|uniref:Uncharacterized protein n=1 Tax=Dreissena polymorpha TaxID=45954 RepID=A0A9D4LB60_DREPO|nr:hypothetical protein DPMN_097112 [Dreissena polymorpha]